MRVEGGDNGGDWGDEIVRPIPPEPQPPEPDQPDPDPEPEPPQGRVLSPLAAHEHRRRVEQPEVQEQAERHIVGARLRREGCVAEVLREHPKNIDELLTLVERHTFEDIKDAEQENKSPGFSGRLKAWMNGEHDFLNHDPEQRRVWTELARRGARCVFNKKFLTGAAVFGAMGIVTGGVGWASGGVLLGAAAGRAIGEMREMVAGETGNARVELLRAERERWESLQDMVRMLRDVECRGGDDLEMSRIQQQLDEARADGTRDEEVAQLEVQFEAARVPDKTLANDLRRAILDVYFKMDETVAIDAVNEKLGKYKTGEEAAGTELEFSYSGDRLSQAEQSLAEKIEKYEKFSRRMTTVGAVAGGAIGAAHSILSGTVEHITMDNVGTQFGHAANGADIWHQVVQHDGAWHHLYNSADEYGQVLQHVHQAGLEQYFTHGLVPIGDQIGHTLGQGIGLNETTGKIAIALVGERVLPVLAAALWPTGEGKPEVGSDGLPKTDSDASERWQTLRKAVPETRAYLENLARVNRVKIPLSPESPDGTKYKKDWYQQGHLLKERFDLHQLPIWLDRFSNERVGICESSPDSDEVIIATKNTLPNGEISYQWHAWRMSEFLKRYEPGEIQSQPAAPDQNRRGHEDPEPPSPIEPTPPDPRPVEPPEPTDPDKHLTKEDVQGYLKDLLVATEGISDKRLQELGYSHIAEPVENGKVKHIFIERAPLEGSERFERFYDLSFIYDPATGEIDSENIIRYETTDKPNQTGELVAVEPKEPLGKIIYFYRDLLTKLDKMGPSPTATPGKPAERTPSKESSKNVEGAKYAVGAEFPVGDGIMFISGIDTSGPQPRYELAGRTPDGTKFFRSYDESELDKRNKRGGLKAQSQPAAGKPTTLTAVPSEGQDIEAEKREPTKAETVHIPEGSKDWKREDVLNWLTSIHQRLSVPVRQTIHAEAGHEVESDGRESDFIRFVDSARNQEHVLRRSRPNDNSNREFFDIAIRDANDSKKDRVFNKISAGDARKFADSFLREVNNQFRKSGEGLLPAPTEEATSAETANVPVDYKDTKGQSTERLTHSDPEGGSRRPLAGMKREDRVVGDEIADAEAEIREAAEPPVERPADIPAVTRGGKFDTTIGARVRGGVDLNALRDSLPDAPEPVAESAVTVPEEPAEPAPAGTPEHRPPGVSDFLWDHTRPQPAEANPEVVQPAVLETPAPVETAESEIPPEFVKSVPEAVQPVAETTPAAVSPEAKPQTDLERLGLSKLEELRGKKIRLDDLFEVAGGAVIEGEMDTQVTAENYPPDYAFEVDDVAGDMVSFKLNGATIISEEGNILPHITEVI